MAYSHKFFMYGTERTGEYIVVAVTPAGRVGYRELGSGEVRIRVEPALYDGAKEEIARFLTRMPGWKQPGDNGQQRFSLVVATDAKTVPLCTALAAIGAYIYDNDVEVNPIAPAWAKLMVSNPVQAMVDGDKRVSVSAAGVERLAELAIVTGQATALLGIGAATIGQMHIARLAREIALNIRELASALEQIAKGEC
jgi:hypothetical protein